MKRLEFRVWDSRSKMMQKVNLIDDTDGDLLVSWDGLEHPVVSSAKELMLCSEFTDDRGQKVFEGDILEALDNVHYLVGFSEGSFIVSDGDVYYLLGEVIDNATIVGNKYSTPDIVKARFQ